MKNQYYARNDYLEVIGEVDCLHNMRWIANFEDVDEILGRWQFFWRLLGY